MALHLVVVLVVAGLLVAATLKHVYAVGTDGTDHFVASVVTGSMTWYLLLFVAAPPAVGACLVYAMVSLWGLFFSVHRNNACPAWALWTLAYPSQVAYSFALWGGLVWLLRFPFALWLGHSVVWPGAWLLPPLALAILGTLHAHMLGNRTRVHTVPGLPLRIVQLSDLHASPLMHRRQLRPIVDRVNSLAPDLILVTGDLVTPFSEQSHQFLLDELDRLEAPIYACPGNHDLPVLETLCDEMSRIGARMLVDQSVRVSARCGAGIELAGVGFHWTDAEEHLLLGLAALPEPPPSVFRILMAHDPRLGKWLPQGRFDLVLSGHTHGGQVGGNMLGIPLTIFRLFGARDQGWWRAGGARHYVHRGNWYFGVPPRMGVAGEIAVFEGDSEDGPPE